METGVVKWFKCGQGPMASSFRHGQQDVFVHFRNIGGRRRLSHFARRVTGCSSKSRVGKRVAASEFAKV